MSGSLENYDFLMEIDLNQSFETSMENVLLQHFGYHSFRKNQAEILRNIISMKRDCCIIMPTGSGKSIL